MIPPDEMRFLSTYLFGDEAGQTATRRIDRRVQRLPGLEHLQLVEQAVTALAA